MWFDEARLDDEQVLARHDAVLRSLAESGARIRREAVDCREAMAAATPGADAMRPRAVVAAGPDSRLLRAVLEPWCPVPFVAWPNPLLPGWVGSLDLVVVLAPEGSDPATAASVAEGVRRGAQVVVAAPPQSLVAEHSQGRWTTLFPVSGRDQLATAVVMLEYLSQIGLGPSADAEHVAQALDQVAIECSPFSDLTVNPAKLTAIGLGDSTPLVWGGTVLAARAARRVAETLRRGTGRAALAGDAEHLLPILDAAAARSVFDDPFADDGPQTRPALLILDDGTDEPLLQQPRRELTAAADARGLRVEVIGAGDGDLDEIARYAALLLRGRYAATYLQAGLVDD